MDSLLAAACEDGEKLAQLLHEKIKSWDKVTNLLQKSLAFSKAQQKASTQVQSQEMLTTVHCTLQKISFLSPRGKFDIQFGKQALALVDNKGMSYVVSFDTVTHILKLPKKVRTRIH